MLRLVGVTYVQYIVGTLLYISMYFVATVIGLTVKKWRRERDWAIASTAALMLHRARLEESQGPRYLKAGS